jgi:hypothetical protein
VSTNCGTFALGILWRLGIRHPLLLSPYQVGQAPAWLLRIGRDLGILRPYSSPAELVPGLLLFYQKMLFYQTPPANEHFEFLLSVPDAKGIAEHAGGGRSRNAIAATVGPVLASSGRPLRYVLDIPQALGATPTRPVLRRGSSGAWVRELQARLIDGPGAVLAVDGVFGSKTEAAVRELQRSAGLAVDGVVGPRTWAALDRSSP